MFNAVVCCVCFDTLVSLGFIYFCLFFAFFLFFKGEHWSFLGHATTTEHSSVHVYAGIVGCVMMMVIMTCICWHRWVCHGDGRHDKDQNLYFMLLVNFVLPNLILI